MTTPRRHVPAVTCHATRDAHNDPMTPLTRLRDMLTPKGKHRRRTQPPTRPTPRSTPYGPEHAMLDGLNLGLTHNEILDIINDWTEANVLLGRYVDWESVRLALVVAAVKPWQQPMASERGGGPMAMG